MTHEPRSAPDRPAATRSLTAAAGSSSAVGSYLRGAGLALAELAATLRPGESRSAYVAAVSDEERIAYDSADRKRRG